MSDDAGAYPATGCITCPIDHVRNSQVSDLHVRNGQVRDHQVAVISHSGATVCLDEYIPGNISPEKSFNT
jgi:hypothetical protein